MANSAAEPGFVEGFWSKHEIEIDSERINVCGCTRFCHADGFSPSTRVAVPDFTELVLLEEQFNNQSSSGGV